MARYELVVGNGTVVVPYVGALRCDVGVRDGRVAALEEDIPRAEAERWVDAAGKLVFPGAVDAHSHLGIYRPIAEDAVSETTACLVGGVTTLLSYFRTGQHYLNKVGPYREIFPEVLAQVSGRSRVDFGFHIGIMTSGQLEEIEWLLAEQGVASFKYYMFYKGLNLAADSTAASDYTMSDWYDFGHLYEYMQRVTESARGRRDAGRVSLSLHCENADLIRWSIEQVKVTGAADLRAYHQARPALSERLSINEAAVLASATGCPVNLLHLSSGEALAAGVEARGRYPQIDIHIETTLHHLALTYETAGDIKGKVNPPIRGQDDVEALWRGVFAGQVNWVGSDHAACMSSLKGSDLWHAQPGFGGTSLFYPVLMSEGYHKRGLPLGRVAELVSANPARAYGLFPRKGTIAPGSDADLAIIDPEKEVVVESSMLLSAQDYTPFEGIRLKGWPVRTILRGETVYEKGRAVGEPRGKYLKRPLG